MVLCNKRALILSGGPCVLASVPASITVFCHFQECRMPVLVIPHWYFAPTHVSLQTVLQGSEEGTIASGGEHMHLTFQDMLKAKVTDKGCSSGTGEGRTQVLPERSVYSLFSCRATLFGLIFSPDRVINLHIHGSPLKSNLWWITFPREFDRQ